MKRIIDKKTFISIAVMVFVYVVISPGVMLYVDDGLHLMLAWNMILAFIPIVVLYVFGRYIDKRTWPRVAVFILWLLFYPNSVYIVTDLIYIDSSAFVHVASPYAPYVYLESLDAYVALLHIFIGAMIGLYTGLLGLNIWYDRVPRKWRIPFLATVFSLSGIAVYIGRFLRYNSWDVLRVFTIIGDLTDRIGWFMIFFVIGYVILQAMVFFLFRLVSDARKETS